MGMTFTKATKSKAKLRLAVMGPSGSGKTYTALRLATGLGGKIAVIDTEHGSASLYADRFEFDALNLDTYDPKTLIGLIAEAEKAGYEVLVVDSLSHFWSGTGGVLEQVDEIKARSKSQNAFSTGWRDMTPIHNKMVDAILAAKLHVIVTARTKTDYILEDNGRGGKVPKKVGMAPILRDGMEYEFTIVGDMDHDHKFVVSKSRWSEIAGKTIHEPDEALAKKMLAWLNDGAEVVEAAKPKPEPQADEPLIIASDATKLIAAAAKRGVDLDRMRAYLREEVAGADPRVGEPPAKWPKRWGKELGTWLRTIPEGSAEPDTTT